MLVLDMQAPAYKIDEVNIADVGAGWGVGRGGTKEWWSREMRTQPSRE